jgi:hypothetical protein
MKAEGTQYWPGKKWQKDQKRKNNIDLVRMKEKETERMSFGHNSHQQKKLKNRKIAAQDRNQKAERTQSCAGQKER